VTHRRWLHFVPVVFALGACMEPDPRPGPIVAMEPRPNPPPARAQPSDPQQARWVARFWSELTPQQQRRVSRRLRTPQADAPPGGTTVAQRWDVMGLEDRRELVFGRGAPPSPQAAPPELSTAVRTVSNRGS
jgi:hypothetical protein